MPKRTSLRRRSRSQRRRSRSRTRRRRSRRRYRHRRASSRSRRRKSRRRSKRRVNTSRLIKDSVSKLTHIPIPFSGRVKRRTAEDATEQIKKFRKAQEKELKEYIIKRDNLREFESPDKRYSPTYGNPYFLTGGHTYFKDEMFKTFGIRPSSLRLSKYVETDGLANVTGSIIDPYYLRNRSGVRAYRGPIEILRGGDADKNLNIVFDRQFEKLYNSYLDLKKSKNKAKRNLVKRKYNELLDLVWYRYLPMNKKYFQEQKRKFEEDVKKNGVATFEITMEYGSGSAGHANAMIYHKSGNRFEYFEPQLKMASKTPGENKEFYDKIEEFTKMLRPNSNFVGPAKTGYFDKVSKTKRGDLKYPGGPQAVREKLVKYPHKCYSWSCMWTQERLKNPTESPSQLTKRLTDYVHADPTAIDRWSKKYVPREFFKKRK